MRSMEEEMVGREVTHRGHQRVARVTLLDNLTRVERHHPTWEWRCGTLRRVAHIAPAHLGRQLHCSHVILHPGTNRDMLEEGDPAPDFTADTDGNRLELRTLRGKPVVLYFYPKDDTPG
jgi:hypothetical protein